MRRSPGLDLLEIAASKLEALLPELVFVGGAIVDFHVTDFGSPIARPTVDVDAIVDVATRIEYDPISQRLKTLGFKEDMEGRVICRWIGHGVILDIMPTHESALGFSNAWYPDTFRHAQEVELPSGASIRIASPVHFLATKLVAYGSRGAGDPFASHDLEDVVVLLNGRRELVDEILNQYPSLRLDVTRRLNEVFAHPQAEAAIEGALATLGDSADRVKLLEKALKRLPGFEGFR